MRTVIIGLGTVSRIHRKALVRRLALIDQRSDDLILFVEFLSGHSDSGPGILETLPVFPISEPGIVGIFVGNRTIIDLFTASIADVGSPIKFAAAFFLKIRTGLVTGGTGSTFNAAEKKEKWNSNFYFRHRNTVRI